MRGEEKTYQPDPNGVANPFVGRRRAVLTSDVEGVGSRVEALWKLAERTRSRGLFMIALRVAASAACRRGDWDRCRDCARRRLSLEGEANANFDRQAALIALILAELATGNPDRAERHLVELGRLTGTTEAPFPFLIPLITMMTGDTGRLDAAEEIIRR
jgi:hypothetical protein